MIDKNKLQVQKPRSLFDKCFKQFAVSQSFRTVLNEDPEIRRTLCDKLSTASIFSLAADGFFFAAAVSSIAFIWFDAVPLRALLSLAGAHLGFSTAAVASLFKFNRYFHSIYGEYPELYIVRNGKIVRRIGRVKK
jgi:hypothetical protein